MNKTNFNLIDIKNKKVIRTWKNISEDYKDKIHLIFNNDMDKIKAKEYTVWTGTLPECYEIDETGNVVEIEKPVEPTEEEETNGDNIG